MCPECSEQDDDINAAGPPAARTVLALLYGLVRCYPQSQAPTNFGSAVFLTMFLKSVFLLVVSIPLAIESSRVANLNVSESTVAKYNCKSACNENFRAALAEDAASFGSTFDEDFYATAANFSSSRPGELLKSNPISPSLLSEIPSGTSAYRFQYVTEDIHGTSTAATGFVVFPYANRTGGHLYHAIAYAHGTSGVFRGCAPSAMPDLYDYGSWSLLLERGYAIVATDYAGLGNNHTAHQYIASPAQANDLYYSVAAVRKVFGSNLSNQWMGVGHSQGGGAVWALAESSLIRDDPLGVGRYVGTVAQAPAVRVKEMAMLAYEMAMNSSSDVDSDRGVLGELGWVVFGLRSIAPNISQSWIKPMFRKRLELAELAQACYKSMESLVADLKIDDVVDISNPNAFGVLDGLQNLTARGRHESSQPILVVQGQEDVSVLPEVVEGSYKASCQSGNDIRLQLYPGLDHTPLIKASTPYFLQWIDDRFGRVKTSGGCSNETIRPFDPANMYAPPDPD